MPLLNTPPAMMAILRDRKSTRLNSSHITTSYAVFCLKKKTAADREQRDGGGLSTGRELRRQADRSLALALHAPARGSARVRDPDRAGGRQRPAPRRDGRTPGRRAGARARVPRMAAAAGAVLLLAGGPHHDGDPRPRRARGTRAASWLHRRPPHRHRATLLLGDRGRSERAARHVRDRRPTRVRQLCPRHRLLPGAQAAAVERRAHRDRAARTPRGRAYGARGRRPPADRPALAGGGPGSRSWPRTCGRVGAAGRQRAARRRAVGRESRRAPGVARGHDPLAPVAGAGRCGGDARGVARHAGACGHRPDLTMTHTTTVRPGRELDALLQSGVIAVIRVPEAVRLRSVARALAAGGVGAVEVTLTTPGAMDAIADLAADTGLAGCVVGAGTVLDEAAAHAVIDAGARFVVSPALIPAVMRACRERDVPCMPGA